MYRRTSLLLLILLLAGCSSAPKATDKQSNSQSSAVASTSVESSTEAVATTETDGPKTTSTTNTAEVAGQSDKKNDGADEEGSDSTITSNVSDADSTVESQAAEGADGQADASTSTDNPSDSEQDSGITQNWRAKVGSLIPAVEANDVAEVRQILQDNTYPINEINEQLESPLLIATHQNNIEIAKLLIDAGADVNQQDEIQDSPYLYAGAEGRTEILAYMIENSNPDQSVRNRFGGNALIPAAEKGHIENVRLLLADGKVNINLQNYSGYTALIEAVALRDGSQVYQDIVRLLVDAGADKTLRDNSGRTAAEYASALGYQNMYQMLQ